MYCPYCGNQIIDNENFCTYCGAKIKQPQYAQQSQYQQNQSQKIQQTPYWQKTIYPQQKTVYNIKWPFILSVIGMILSIIGSIGFILGFIVFKNFADNSILSNICGYISFFGNAMCILTLIFRFKNGKHTNIKHPNLTTTFSIIGISMYILAGIVFLILLLGVLFLWGYAETVVH